MSIIITPIVYLVIFGLLLLFAMAILSPFETREWWKIAPLKKGEQPPTVKAEDNDSSIYIIYLTAIGGVSADEISSREQRFLAGLEEQLETAVFIDDVFPFSVSNNPLTGDRHFSKAWNYIHEARRRGSIVGGLLSSLIFVRNLLQVGVSGDPRYGPIYNVGVAKELIRSLLKHGYPPNSGKPIVVMGWSGGGQIAIGVVRYLSEGLHAPVSVMSIGGVMAADPGISYVDKLYHLQGSRDSFPKLGEILYPGRWAFLKNTEWSKAKKNGRFTTIVPGPMRHTGKEDYFDRHSTLPDGQTYLERTIEAVADLLKPKNDE